MFKRRLSVLLVGAAALAAAIGCTDLSYNCAGICGVEPGNGDFEGVINATSLGEALAICNQAAGCDAGFTPTCSCYLQE